MAERRPLTVAVGQAAASQNLPQRKKARLEPGMSRRAGKPGVAFSAVQAGADAALCTFFILCLAIGLAVAPLAIGAAIGAALGAIGAAIGAEAAFMGVVWAKAPMLNADATSAAKRVFIWFSPEKR